MTRRRRTPVPSLILSGRRLLLAGVVAVLLALVWRYYNPPPRAPENLAEGLHQVERVVDGDTLLLTNHARVRLIGTDTPETVKPNHPVEPWGPQASQFTRQFVAGGQVRLEFDRERLDKYGRFLAYVWVGDRMLNEELIRAGLARAEFQYHYASSMKTRFRHAQADAKSSGRGIWSERAAIADTL